MENMLSPADVAVLSGNARNNNDSGFGDNGSWWIIIFLIFAFMGWGRNGNGFGGGNSGGVADNYVLASDFAALQRQIDSATSTIERKLDATQEGLCDGFYAQNTNLLNGFSGVQQTLCQGFAGINQNIVTNGYETRNSLNTLGYNLQNCCCDIKTQIADCCCQTQRAIDGINYNLASSTNAITNAMCLNTRDIIDNQNANYRAIHEELIANRIEDKNARIQEQQNEINALRLAASQERQNNYLLSELKPCPKPSYLTCSPYQAIPVQYVAANGCGCDNGCGNYI